MGEGCPPLPSGAGRRVGTRRRRSALAVAIALGGIAAVVGVWLAAIAWLPRNPVLATAERLAGERWYAVVFQHTPIGHYRTRNGRTAAGHFEFHTTLRFRLRDGVETRMEDRFLFHRRAPHGLLRASHMVETTPGSRRAVVVEDGVARVDEAGAQWRSELRDADARCADPPVGGAGDGLLSCRAERELTLREYLAVETWLAAGDVALGARRRARAVDFDHLALVAPHWQVAAIGDRHVELVKVETPPPRQPDHSPPHRALHAGVPTRIVLDAGLVPERMEVGGLFVLRRVPNEAVARLWQRGAPLFADQAPGARTDRPIRAPLALRRLVVAVQGEDADAAQWLRRLDVESAPRSPLLLTVVADRRRPVRPNEAAAALAATLSFPAQDAQLRALATQAVGDLPRGDAKADALVGFVHGFLRYEDSATPRSVFDAVRTRQGDCTEFADLYTTLARAAGLPARTIVGLAYRSGAAADAAGEFALHAWNEVAVDGVWRGVDPTWNQTRLDATHMPVRPDDVLAAAVALPHLVFRVVEARY